MKFKYFIVFAIVVLAHVIAGVLYSGYALWWILITIFLLLGILVVACSKINWNFFLVSTNRIPLTIQQLRDDTKPVALTFDDGPHENTLKILDVLKAYNVKATFFVIGKAIAGNETILKRIVDEGHLIGNHSYSHEASFYWKSANAMQEDILKCNAHIEAVTGSNPNIFRPPFGVTNPNLAKALQQVDMQSVGWTLRSFDTTAKDNNALLTKILKQVQVNHTILLHDRCNITVTILPQLIEGLQEKGLSFAFPVKVEA